MITPMLLSWFPFFNSLATPLGRKFSSFITSNICSLVRGLTVFLAFMTAETVPFDTPARLATSSMVILFISFSVISYKNVSALKRFDYTLFLNIIFFNGKIKKNFIYNRLITVNKNK